MRPNVAVFDDAVIAWGVEAQAQKCGALYAEGALDVIGEEVSRYRRSTKFGI